MNVTDLPARMQTKIVVTDAGCWQWVGGLDGGGYGAIRVAGVQSLAHRYSYELTRGAIPDGLQLDHLCRNRACVNPAHLEPVTGRVNVARGMSPAGRSVLTRLTTGKCHKGHREWVRDPRYPDTFRCRPCGIDRKRSEHQAISDAAASLGITQKQYGAIYGWSAKTARRILRADQP